MTDDELDNLEALSNAATPGPWYREYPSDNVFEDNGNIVAVVLSDSNRPLISECRSAVPRLIACVRSLRATLAREIERGREMESRTAGNRELWDKIDAVARRVLALHSESGIDDAAELAARRKVDSWLNEYPERSVSVSSGGWLCACYSDVQHAKGSGYIELAKELGL